MVLLSDAIESKKFDIRMRERNVHRGSVSPKEVDKHVADLQDEAANATYISLDELTAQPVAPSERR